MSIFGTKAARAVIEVASIEVSDSYGAPERVWARTLTVVATPQQFTAAEANEILIVAQAKAEEIAARHPATPDPA